MATQALQYFIPSLKDYSQMQELNEDYTITKNMELL
jgi:hypothetical protein